MMTIKGQGNIKYLLFSDLETTKNDVDNDGRNVGRCRQDRPEQNFRNSGKFSGTDVTENARRHRRGSRFGRRVDVDVNVAASLEARQHGQESADVLQRQVKQIHVRGQPVHEVSEPGFEPLT